MTDSIETTDSLPRGGTDAARAIRSLARLARLDRSRDSLARAIRSRATRARLARLARSAIRSLALREIVVHVRAECLKVLQLSFFAHINKSVRVEEFANLQNASTNAVAATLRESWVSNIHGHVRSQLKDVRKGWFNLDEV